MKSIDTKMPSSGSAARDGAAAYFPVQRASRYKIEACTGTSSGLRVSICVSISITYTT